MERAKEHCRACHTHPCYVLDIAGYTTSRAGIWLIYFLNLRPFFFFFFISVGPCALLIHPTTNWWRMRGHKSFIAFNRKPSPLVLERIVKSLTIPPSQCGSNDSNLWPWLWYHLLDHVPYRSIQRPIGERWGGTNLL